MEKDLRSGRFAWRLWWRLIVTSPRCVCYPSLLHTQLFRRRYRQRFIFRSNHTPNRLAGKVLGYLVEHLCHSLFRRSFEGAMSRQTQGIPASLIRLFKELLAAHVFQYECKSIFSSSGLWLVNPPK